MPNNYIYFLVRTLQSDRGCTVQIKYLRVPDEIVDKVKEEQATAQAQRGGGHRGGRGGDRGDRGGRGRGMGGRGRGRGGRGQS